MDPKIIIFIVILVIVILFNNRNEYFAEELQVTDQDIQNAIRHIKNLPRMRVSDDPQKISKEKADQIAKGFAVLSSDGAKIVDGKLQIKKEMGEIKGDTIFIPNLHLKLTDFKNL
jgi:hypothetical protein